MVLRGPTFFNEIDMRHVSSVRLRKQEELEMDGIQHVACTDGFYFAGRKDKYNKTRGILCARYGPFRCIKDGEFLA
jgi:hypothetical protein